MHLYYKASGRVANGVDPGLTAPSVRSGLALFAYVCMHFVRKADVRNFRTLTEL